ncbi:apolipoprotein C-IV [Thunnus albacares]|uniref:apolipoprotein C-IV n=1 Tax=Thunnus albacares TaxID=8236 RepID=UPI001CF6ACB7|nr:apolipoprotein C-IV [Thunnus albacares]
MHLKLLVSCLILLSACGPLLAQTAAPQPDPEGILHRLADRAREVKAQVQNVGEVVLGIAGTYYEDHLQPVADSYAQWASSLKSSVWEKIQTTIDNYMPFKATTQTDQLP